MELHDWFMNRHTVRRYSDRPVDGKLLGELLEEAAKAPTTGTMQLYSVILTSTPEGKRRLAPAHFNQPQVEGCQVLLTICADTNRFVKWCEASGANPGFDNFQSFTAAMLDAALFAQQFTTAAEMRGLGCCWLGTTTYNAPMIAEALGLPERVVPIGTLTLGWPDESVEEGGAYRLPTEAFVHDERYVDPTPEAVRRFYADIEARPDSRRFVEENGKQTLAQVFTDVRYPRESAEHFSEVFARFIEDARFEIPKIK